MIWCRRREANPHASSSISHRDLRRKTPHTIPHTSTYQIDQINQYNTIPFIFKTRSTRSTHQNDMEPTLNQQVPGSSPGRRTKVVKLYGLMHRNGCTNWAMG